MSQARLYLDEDAMRRSLVFALRARNVDVLSAAEAEMVNRDDQDHLAAAAASGRVLYIQRGGLLSSIKAGFRKNAFTPGSSSRHSSVTQPARNFGGSCG